MRNKVVTGLLIALLTAGVAIAVIASKSGSEPSANALRAKKFEGTIIGYSEIEEGVIVELDCSGYLDPVSIIITDSTLFSDEVCPIIDSRYYGVLIEVFSEYWTHEVGGHDTPSGKLYPATIISLPKDTP